MCWTATHTYVTVVKVSFMQTKPIVTYTFITNVHCIAQMAMYAEPIAIDDMKKDVEDLLKVATEKGDPMLLLERVYFATKFREKDYLDYVTEHYEYELAVSKITGEDNSQRFAELVLSLLPRYNRKEFLILFDSAARLLKLRTPKNRGTTGLVPFAWHSLV